MKTITLTKAGNYTYTLNKEGQEITIIGRFKVENQDKLNLNLLVIHQAKNTSAKISLKATVDDRAYAGIQGKVLVEEKATGTRSFLEERILLLSSTATAEAVPDLEIKTNDVSCSHAATVGEIDEKQLFYLSTRGLPQEEAKRLIAQGFLK